MVWSAFNRSGMSAFVSGVPLHASLYEWSLFAISMYGSRVVVSKIPKYPRSSTVKIDFVTFSFACFSVLLNAPRVNFALVSLKRAFSSYFSGLLAIVSAKTSISRVSSCVWVKWLFPAINLAIGSFMELKSHAWTPSFSFKLVSSSSMRMNTVLYTGSVIKTIVQDHV
jgi:hypothetical protein